MLDKKHINMLATRLAQEGVDIKVKPNYQKWWHFLAGWFTWCLMKLVGKDFHAMWTHFGTTIYPPSHYDESDIQLDNPHIYKMICHELAHVYDYKEYGWYYMTTYILSWRMRTEVWETRGYGMEMIAEGRIHPVDNASVVDTAKIITGPTYLWGGRFEKVKGTFDVVKNKANEHDYSLVYDPNLVDIFPNP